MLIPGRLAVQKLATLTGHQSAIYSLIQGLEPHLVLSCGADGQLAEWDLKDPGLGRLLARIPSTVYAMHLDKPSGLVCIGQNGHGLQWIALADREAAYSLALGTDDIFFIEKVGDLYLAGLSGGELVGVSLEDKPQVVFRTRLSNQRLRVALWLPEMNLLAVGGSDGMLRLIFLDKGKIIDEVAAHTNSIFTLAYVPQNRWLLSAGRDARINAFSLDDGLRLEKSVPAHLYAINHLTMRADGQMLASCSMDKTIKIWDPQNLQLIKVIDRARHGGHSSSVNRLLWAQYQDLLVTCSDDRTLSVWHLSAELT